MTKLFLASSSKSDLPRICRALIEAGYSATIDDVGYLTVESHVVDEDGIASLARALSGVAVLVFGPGAALRLNHWIDRAAGRDMIMFVEQEVVEIREELVVTVSGGQGEVIVASPEKDACALAKGLRANPGLERLLGLFGSGDFSWVNLYRAVEIVSQAVGGDSKLAATGWISAKSLGRFKHTANSPSVIGVDARHGKDVGQPPQKPMTWLEAKALVSSVVAAYLG